MIRMSLLPPGKAGRVYAKNASFLNNYRSADMKLLTMLITNVIIGIIIVVMAVYAFVTVYGWTTLAGVLALGGISQFTLWYEGYRASEQAELDAAVERAHREGE